LLIKRASRIFWSGFVRTNVEAIPRWIFSIATSWISNRLRILRIGVLLPKYTLWLPFWRALGRILNLVKIEQCFNWNRPCVDGAGVEDFNTLLTILILYKSCRWRVNFELQKRQKIK
jgi:hypothetical protein